MKKMINELKSGFMKGAGFMLAVFIISILIIGVYAFAPSSQGPNVEPNYIDTNSPLLKILDNLELVNDSFHAELTDVDNEINVVKSLLAVSGTIPTCANNQILKHDGISWICENKPTGLPTCANNQIPKFNGASWICENKPTGLPTCANNQIVKFNGASWICANPPSTLGTLSCVTRVVSSGAESNTVTCAAGEICTGGGAWRISSGTYIGNQPSGNGWTGRVEGGGGVRVYARCCKII